MTAGDRQAEALTHLQAGLLELIAAARLLLDVAEEAVREPGGLAAVVSETLGAFAAQAREGQAHPAEPPKTGRRRPGVERIKIS